MSIRNLEHLFRPRSIAVIGASETPRSVCATVLHNVLEGKFSGPILPVARNKPVLMVKADGVCADRVREFVRRLD